jgi:hypothetical protein
MITCRGKYKYSVKWYTVVLLGKLFPVQLRMAKSQVALG